jgi:multidrug efflux pump subunit AcrA (membrane-fusion protein)
MSTIASAPESTSAPPAHARPRRPVAWRRWLILTAVLICAIAAPAWYGTKAYRALSASSQVVIPTATVQRGDLSLAVTARGSVNGGNPEVLTAPLTGGSDMHITELRRTGEPVKAGDVVIQFDITEQEYKLKEAEADLAEAEQHLIQAKAQQGADQEEDRYALLKAQSDVKLAELDVRKNPIIPAITAKQNDLALAAAKDHLAQLEQNLANRKATNDAAIAMQEAGRGKAEAQGGTARRNIDAMTLRAHRSGYVALKQNSSGNFFFFGMTLPLYQVGDTVRPGMAVAEIPDLSNWELSANIDELDRGHLASGDKVAITVIALPEHAFSGHIKEIGGTSGPPWNRRFECKVAIDDPSPDLRPGMSAEIVITTDQMKQVLWLPAQALFESDGRTFVYLRSGSSFAAHDVKLVRRNETRVVVSGLNAGQVVALANPMEITRKKSGSSGAMQSLPK